MKVLLKSVEVIEKSFSSKEKVNILIEDGIISRISNESTQADTVIEGENLKVSPGWVDFGAFLGDPGFEHKEDLETGSMAASLGGFTELVCLPNTYPVIQDKKSINYYLSGNAHRITTLRPLGAVTVKADGVELTEMLDMHKAGAVGFTDGFKSINNSDIILKTLLYLSKIGSVFINRPNECNLSNSGVAHEGINSTMLGLKGIPSLAEEIAIVRDLKLLEYAGGKIHFSNISSANSVALIREAKGKGLNVTCDIAAHQIAFDDEVLKEFDTNYKVNPPFRSQMDIDALWKGLKDGTIDVITSSHNPQDEESKKLEFDLAEFGIIGLETAFSIVNSKNDSLTLHELIDKLSTNPRKILGLPSTSIKVGEKANLTVFDPVVKWVYHENSIISKSKNSPFVGFEFTGKPLAVFNNNQFFISPLVVKEHK